MERPKILVVYFSRSGRTKRLARAIAAAAHAEVEELRDPTDRSGVVGYLRSGAEAFAGVLAPIEHPRRDPAEYALVVIGTPVWNMSLSAPVRTWLWYQRARLTRVAFFATLGGMGDRRVFEQMAVAAGREPVATLALREGELKRGVPRAAVAAFVESALATPRRRPTSRRRLRAVA